MKKMLGAILGFGVGLLVGGCGSDTGSRLDKGAGGTAGVSLDAAVDSPLLPDAPYTIPDTIAFPQPTGPFTIVRGQRRTLIDPTRDLEGNVLAVDAGASDGGNTEAGSTRPLSAEIWYPSDSPGSGATVPYMDSAETAGFFLAAQRVLPNSQLAAYSPEVLNHVRTHSYASLPFANSLTIAPVLLFSPGYNALPRAYTAFIEEAVSWGYIVVAISHTLYTPVTTFADGSTIGMTHSGDDMSDPGVYFTAAVWLADARFVLDQLVKTASLDPYGEIEGHVDLTKVGMFGHSFGGSTSIGMLVTDDRVMAAINLDGSIYRSWPAQPFSNPVLILQEPGVDSSVNNVFNQAAGRAFLAVLANSLHLNFSDMGIIAAAIQLDPSLWSSNLLGTIDPVRAVQEVNGYVEAFFDSTLKGMSSPLLEGPTAQYPDIVDFSKKP